MQEGTTPSTKTCRHCGAEGPVSASKCPSCGKGYKDRSMLKLWSAIVVLGLLTVGGCGLLVKQELDAEENRAEEQSITIDQFRQMKMGLPSERVRAILKVDPEMEETEKWDSVHLDKEIEVTCLYYNRSGRFPDMFRFCFDDDKLSAKDTW